ncbi:MAG: OmpA family protein [Bacteroidota bacterium]|nr:OmpA family protein [Bacteroidota bacterium]
MKRLLFILLFFPILSFTQNKDYKNFDKAVKYNADGNTEKAIKYANKALENDPNWSQLNLLLASIYANNNQIELAADYILKVYNEDDPQDVKGIEQVVKLYYYNGFYNEALFYAEKIIAQDTNKHRFTTEMGRYVANCKFAIEAIKNPVDFNPINLDNNINSAFADFVNTVSIDGKKLFFTRRIEYDNRQSQEDLFSFSFKDSTLISLPFNTQFNEGAITVSPNGRMCVYTACDRENSIGGCDLFIRNYSTENGWSQEYNLGKNVNSKNWETQASFSPDGKYLYFISNKEGGVGGDDVWRSEITAEGFLKAENLGAPINTKYNEMSPFLHPDNLTFYFGSNGHIGMGDYDIYVSRRINIIDEWESPKNIGYPINTHNTENSLVVANDGRTAYYTSNKSGFGLEDIFVFDLPDNMQADEISTIELEIITQEIGEEVVLRNVTFTSNSSEIDASSYAELDKLIACLKKNPNLQIEIQGHTDDIGSELNNLILSDERAKAVYDYLIIKVENSLSYIGYGESKPLVPNESENDRKLNRRTSFVIQ